MADGGFPTPPRPGGAGPSRQKGPIPEMSKLGEGNVGYTGLFAVKIKARQQGEDDLTFPEPLEPINFDKPKHGLSGQEENKKSQPACCPIL